MQTNPGYGCAQGYAYSGYAICGQMAAIPSTRFVTAPFAQLKSSIHLTLRPSSSSSSTCFRFRVRVKASPDFISGIRMSSSAAESIASPLPAEDVVIQYVVLRRDLIDTWPLGSVVTQGCHASVAAIWSHKEDPHTVDYCSLANIDFMHKVTLEVKGETQLSNLSEKLTAGGIAHKLWIEQPENIPTCLATKPYPKSVVSLFFKKLKLCK